MKEDNNFMNHEPTTGTDGIASDGNSDYVNTAEDSTKKCEESNFADSSQTYYSNSGEYSGQSGESSPYTQNKESYVQYNQPYNSNYSNPYNRYNNAVNDSESQYSPYSQSNSQHNYQPPYNPASATDNADNKPKKSKGFKGFVIALIAVIVCAAIVLTVYPMVSNNSEKSDEKSSNGENFSLDIDSAKGSSSGNTDAEKVAATAKKFNVGILLYGSSQSFMNSSTNSLVGEGSGIIMKEDSTKTYTYILTCAHVISGAKTSKYSMTVQDYEGNKYDGELVGYDAKTDIGVIRIKKTGLSLASFGDSSKLNIGETVYAIGNPGGIEFFGSFTNGIVSSIDRPLSSQSGYEMRCIQHTAPINSGNSGGALLNSHGQVIGINSSKIASTGYEGMGFAIPVTDAKPIIEDIISNGYVTNRPKLGITYKAASNLQQYALVVKLKDLPSGSLVVASISSDSSLAKSDVKEGDIITAVNGENLDTPDVLLDKIENGKVGDVLKLTICRVNEDYSIKTFTVDAKLVEDKGSGTETETTQSQNYDSSDMEEFFEKFFQNGGF